MNPEQFTAAAGSYLQEHPPFDAESSRERKMFFDAILRRDPLIIIDGCDQERLLEGQYGMLTDFPQPFPVPDRIQSIIPASPFDRRNHDAISDYLSRMGTVSRETFHRYIQTSGVQIPSEILGQVLPGSTDSLTPVERYGNDLARAFGNLGAPSPAPSPDLTKLKEFEKRDSAAGRAVRFIQHFQRETERSSGSYPLAWIKGGYTFAFIRSMYGRLFPFPSVSPRDVILDLRVAAIEKLVGLRSAKMLIAWQAFMNFDAPILERLKSAGDDMHALGEIVRTMPCYPGIREAITDVSIPMVTDADEKVTMYDHYLENPSLYKYTSDLDLGFDLPKENIVQLAQSMAMYLREAGYRVHEQRFFGSFEII
jgi:hypothetical protein